MASQTFGNLEPYADWNQLASSAGTVVAAFVAIVIVGVGLSRILPTMPFFENLVLAPPGSNADSAEPKLRSENEQSAQRGAAAVGLQGMALSVLRPAGKAQFEGRVLDVISDGPFIPAGSTIEIVTASRTRIVVRQVGT